MRAGEMAEMRTGKITKDESNTGLLSFTTTYLLWASVRADEQGPHPADERNLLASKHSGMQRYGCSSREPRAVNVGENGVVTPCWRPTAPTTGGVEEMETATVGAIGGVETIVMGQAAVEAVEEMRVGRWESRDGSRRWSRGDAKGA